MIKKTLTSILFIALNHLSCRFPVLRIRPSKSYSTFWEMWNTFAPMSVPSLAPPFAFPLDIAKSSIARNVPDLLAKIGFS
jgi:hypothetical protein